MMKRKIMKEFSRRRRRDDDDDGSELRNFSATVIQVGNVGINNKTPKKYYYNGKIQWTLGSNPSLKPHDSYFLPTLLQKCKVSAMKCQILNVKFICIDDLNLSINYH